MSLERNSRLNKEKKMNKVLLSIFSAFCVLEVFAEPSTDMKAREDSVLKKFEEQGYRVDSMVVSLQDTTASNRRVVTNPFSYNTFLTGAVGVHKFHGDFNDYGKFSETLDYDWYLGAGKWFTPLWGAKLEGGMGRSRGFVDSKYDAAYAYGDLFTTEDGLSYYKTKNKWFDVSLSGLFNISRAICGYEGANSDKLMNQFVLGLGFGFVGHYGYPDEYNVSNDFGVRSELQYSRFLDRAKQWSVDAKFRAQFYQTDFDNISKYNKLDRNLGVALGLTYYFKNNGWNYYESPKTTTAYLSYVMPEPEPVEEVRVPQYGQIMFYVFYPNNYSGSNDAPVDSKSVVNTMDYLAAGVFTQKKYSDNNSVDQRLAKGKSPLGLNIEDFATVKANKQETLDGLTRGYEIDTTLSALSLNKDTLASYKNKHGYYYAPIWNGRQSWQYRVDNAAQGQNLTDVRNYTEDKSYGLNSNLGIDIVRSNMEVKDADLYSFADIYAAIEGLGGYIDGYVDKEKVENLSRILNEGEITNICVSGAATNQDNSTNQEQAQSRNTALAQNRTQSVLMWLRSCGISKLTDANLQVFMVNDLRGPVHQIEDKSTRSLNAKLNRCVKVTVDYMY